MSYSVTATTLQSAPTLRVGDCERDAACERLTEHFAAGRLSEAEVQQRISMALSASHGHQLDALLADLPRQSVRHRSTPQQQVAPAGLVVAGEVLLGLLSAAAVVCFVLLFLLLSLGGVNDRYGALTLGLGGLAGATSTAGLCYFWSKYARRRD